MTTTAQSVVATRARPDGRSAWGVGLGARENLWACLAHLPALRALPGFEVTALSTAHRNRQPAPVRYTGWR